MQDYGNANLALILLPQLRDRLLSREPAVLFSDDMRHIRWANAAGVEMFGGEEARGLFTEEFDASHPLIRQFLLAASQIGPGGSIVRGFRITRGGKTQFIQCELQKPDFDASETGTMLVGRDERLRSNLAEHEAAAKTIAIFEPGGAGIAIIDAFGLTLAADENFLQMDFSESDLEHCSHRARQAEERMAWCRLLSADGVVRDAVFASIGENSDRFLVCLPGESDSRLHPSRRAAIAADEHKKEAAGGAGEASAAEENPGGGEIELDIERAGGAGKPQPPTPLKHAVAEPEANSGDASEADPQKAQSRRPMSPIRSLLDIWYVRRGEEGAPKSEPRDDGGVGDGDNGEAAAARTEDTEKKNPAGDTGGTKAQDDEPAGSTGEDEGGDFVFSADADPVRFAWTIDADGVFRSVSPELGQTVGPNAADIAGRKWRDVAAVFGFDRSGDIAALMEARDTWSGKTVLWPVQGTDLAVPVDFSALPVFSATRNFDGFRGFGIIRAADAVVDPDEIGLALASPTAPFGDISGEEVTTAEAGEDNGAPGNSGNVVNLPSKRIQPKVAEEGLSGSEAQAFAEIGRKLVEGETGSASTADAEAELKGRIGALEIPALVLGPADILFANTSLLEIAGYSKLDEIVEAGGFEAIFQSSVSGGRPVMALRARDGGEIQVNPHIRTVRWGEASVLLITFATPGAGDAPESEEAGYLSRISELENILDTATDGILLIGEDARIEAGNASAEALFGRPLSEVAGEPLTVLFAPESHKLIDDYLAELRQPGVAGIINDGREVIGLEAKGGLIPLFITVGRNGESQKYSVVLRDITQWKKAEEELVTARRFAETASEQKTEFLARVSHEIRTPLNAIIGFSDVMIEERFGPVGNERYREYLRDINRSGVHVLDLINDLLDISKIEAGKMDLSYEAVDLNQVVSETVALLQPQANGERIIIRTSLSRAVPKVVADVRSMRQIILNLVSNAIKFTPMNGQVIVSTVYEGNGEVVLRVRDTGRGMSQNEIEHAMKPFNQINVADEKRGQGTGLGLPLTKALVEANRAYFDLESAPGEGTIAHVHFPTQRVLAD
jgi:PAS domain S-box-containing protein